MIATAQTGKTVWETNLPLERIGRGKVRDIYAVGDDKLLIVVTDRLSAFDVVLPSPIPFKGKVLNQISAFWFSFFNSLVKHHLLTADVNQMGFSADFLKQHGDDLRGRAMLVRKTKPLLVECVVRGYLTGSGWKDYLKTGAVCGHALPKGLKQCQKLPEPIFTPSTKAMEGHDENIDFQKASAIVGPEVAKKIRDLTILLYLKGSEWAESKGILIADTKFEFGILNNEVILIDEALTPDSSRFWPKDGYEPGKDQPSFDKQIVRNYLESSGWDKKAPGPKLPEDIVSKTSAAYRDIYKRLADKELS
ncbi:MAG TPA: phosphoribosylaminoimidazolesuccinocarboxamide synthase [Candidatus Omnitrophota bacterium]|nr:phosphoribosylaminoimidazolesuccinocarboxamide synthase [Candidatus Omnitrophota bacterium]